MNLNRTRWIRQGVAAGMLACGAMNGLSAAAAPADSGGERARFERERAACLDGRSNQARSTCLAEAQAAYAQARQGRLGDEHADLARNARQRCQGLPQADREDCLARMDGRGTVSGSVEGGGLLRELVTVEPAPVPAPR